MDAIRAHISIPKSTGILPDDSPSHHRSGPPISRDFAPPDETFPPPKTSSPPIAALKPILFGAMCDA